MIMKNMLLETGSKGITALLKIFSEHLGVGSGGFLSCNLKSMPHNN